MRTRLPLLVLLALPACAHSQSLLGIGVRAGYTISGSFTNKFGDSGHLQGPEFGLDIPIGLPLPINGLGGLQFSLSPSLLAATGSDFQGNVYRIIASARLSLPSSPVYVRVGAGYSYASASNGDFNSQAAYETQFTLGVGILNNLPAVKISAEVSYHQSSLVQVQGWTFGLAAKF